MKLTKNDKKIIQLKEQYYRLLPGKESLITLINETEIPEHVYNSNAIENSTLTLEETEKILLQIDLERFINEREIFEAKNLARVMEYIEQKKSQNSLTIETIQLLHKMLIGNIRDDIAGRFRNSDEWVRVGNYIAVDPSEIVQRIEKMITEYQADTSLSIIKKIAKLHLTFELIHPFVDGNGRIGRVINNMMLIREGYPPINITFANRAEYYDAFKEFHETQKTNTMEKIVTQALINSFYKRLAYLYGGNMITLSEYAKKYNLSPSNLINKAKRQTIPVFMEKGNWKVSEKMMQENR